MLIRKITYAILLYLAVTYAVVYESYDGFLLEVILIAVPLISFIIMLIQKIFIKAGFEQSEIMARRNEEYAVKINVKNPTPFPVSYAKAVMREEGVKDVQELAFLGFSDSSIELTGENEHCGIDKIYLEKIYIYDYFKIFRINIAKKSVAEVTVLPRLIGVEEKRIYGNIDGDGKPSQKKGDDVSEIVEIREYQAGDSVRKIHQKLSMRMNRLMIKEFGSEEQPSVRCEAVLRKGSQEEDKMVNDTVIEFMYDLMADYIGHSQNIAVTRPGASAMALETAIIGDMDSLDEYISDVMRYFGNKESFLKYFPDLERQISLTDGNNGSLLPYYPDRQEHFCLYFTAEGDSDVLLNMEDGQIARTCIYVPESYADKMDRYVQSGFDVSYIRENEVSDEED